jgi:hypothetical protein
MSATHNYYQMNMGAYQHEEEVMLVDGTRFTVVSIADSSALINIDGITIITLQVM